MIGYYGNVTFQVYGNYIYTPNGLKREVGPWCEEHKLIGLKPKSEFIAPQLEKITFSILLNGLWRVKPRDEMERWIQMANTDYTDYLVLGGTPLGQDQWETENVSQDWTRIFNDGKLFSGTIDVTLKEYISTG